MDKVEVRPVRISRGVRCELRWGFRQVALPSFIQTAPVRLGCRARHGDRGGYYAILQARRGRPAIASRPSRGRAAFARHPECRMRDRDRPSARLSEPPATGADPLVEMRALPYRIVRVHLS